MAMAYAMSKLEHPQLPGTRLFVPKAFIVDHGARVESTREAIQVQKNLQSIGIDSDILRLRWAPKELPSLLKNGFEEAARWRRYQVIARAALTDRIYDLFTGHHRDDRMETSLMRLIRNDTPNILSLEGMSMLSPIPCCGMIFNARPRSAPTALPQRISHVDADELSKDLLIEETSPWTGVNLIRPLLMATKKEILSTCSKFGIPYVEDNTNFDPAFTSRNAVRYLRTHYKLPRALQEQSLDSLQRRGHLLANDCEEQAQYLWNYVVKFHLHSRTGLLKVTVRKIHQSLTPREQRGFSYAMARLFELASAGSPEDWPSLLDKQSTKRLIAYFQNAEGSSSDARGRTVPITFQKAILRLKVSRGDAANNTLSFTISRSPMRSAESIINTTTLERGPSLSSSNGKQYSFWNLWDHRFWIRVVSEEENVIENVVLRPYLSEDVSAVRAMLECSKDGDQLMQQLAESAPGDIRFTIPVLVYQGNIVAFPTLGHSFVPASRLSFQCNFARSWRTARFLSRHVHGEHREDSSSSENQEAPTHN